MNPAEFLSIYTIAIQVVGGRDEKVFANYFPLALKPNVRSWLMHLPENSILTWLTYAMSSLAPSWTAIKNQGGPVTCSFSNRKKERLCGSTCSGSAEFTGTFQISTRQM